MRESILRKNHSPALNESRAKHLSRRLRELRREKCSKIPADVRSMMSDVAAELEAMDKRASKAIERLRKKRERARSLWRGVNKSFQDGKLIAYSDAIGIFHEALT